MGRRASLRCKRLSSLDEAKALVELVYQTYGLTFHRDWMYQPEGMLELNRRGDITSFVAMQGSRVVGHTGFVRPFFEQQPPGAPRITSPEVQEVGLSVVEPGMRGFGVQTQLGQAMYAHAVEKGIFGVLMRCVTHHTHSQRNADRTGGAAVGLLLGCVPRWVRYDQDGSAGAQALSSMLYFTPLSPEAAPPGLSLPDAFAFIRGRAAAMGLERGPAAPAAEGPCELICTWSGSKQLASILVPRLGDDLIDRLRQTVSWLVRGHIAHITVYLAADRANLEGLGPALRALGLSAAGWIPRFFEGGRDALLLQTLAWQDIDPDLIRTADAGGAAVKAAVVEAWRAARDPANEDTGRHGAVVVRLKDGRPRSASPGPAPRPLGPGVGGR